MKNSSGQLAVHKLECEFIPPLDLPETWGLAWDRQIEAALAWQSVGGDLETGFEQSRGNNVRQFVDRRTRSVIIDFPDRRKAA